MSGKDLIERIQNGDKKAFGELVYSFKSQVFKTCYGFLHDKEDAEDIAQEVFLEAYLHINSFRNESKISTWLYRISVNKSLNFIRDHKKRFLYHPGENHPDIIDDSPLADEEITRKERKKILHKVISQLPKNQRVAFVLNKYRDLSYKEIAEIMNLSLSSVESLIFRAKNNVQREILNIQKKNVL